MQRTELSPMKNTDFKKRSPKYKEWSKRMHPGPWESKPREAGQASLRKPQAGWSWPGWWGGPEGAGHIWWSYRVRGAQASESRDTNLEIRGDFTEILSLGRVSSIRWRCWTLSPVEPYSLSRERSCSDLKTSAQWLWEEVQEDIWVWLLHFRIGDEGQHWLGLWLDGFTDWEDVGAWGELRGKARMLPSLVSQVPCSVAWREGKMSRGGVCMENEPVRNAPNFWS